ncbi:MAG: CoA-binding protein [Desulfuromonadales bacterium]|nr:CoA-binding protein [Desulfuromonadales bacterium]
MISTMELAKKIEHFFASAAFGVAGASRRRDKFGNKVLRCYIANGLRAIPVHPAEQVIEGLDCVRSISALPAEVISLSIITPPHITETLVREALVRGIENIWMQPGAESQAAVDFCLENDITPIYGGPCLLVELGFVSH